MNVLFADAKVPDHIVLEMDELPDTDVVLVIGANDTVNPAAADDPGLTHRRDAPSCRCGRPSASSCSSNSMATGYAGVQKPPFFNDNAAMLFADAKVQVGRSPTPSVPPPRSRSGRGTDLGARPSGGSPAEGLCRILPICGNTAMKLHRTATHRPRNGRNARPRGAERSSARGG